MNAERSRVDLTNATVLDSLGRLQGAGGENMRAVWCLRNAELKSQSVSRELAL